MTTSNLWQEFKTEYPEGKGADADFAWQVWRELLPDEKQAAVNGLKLWKMSEEWSERRYIPSAGNFLARQKWKEKPTVRKTPQVQTRPRRLGEHVANFDVEAYRRRAQDPENYIYKPKEIPNS